MNLFQLKYFRANKEYQTKTVREIVKYLCAFLFCIVVKSCVQRLGLCIFSEFHMINRAGLEIKSQFRINRNEFFGDCLYIYTNIFFGN